MKNSFDGPEALKVLCLEDSPEDAKVIRETLVRSGQCMDFDHAETAKEFNSLLGSRSYDIILADYSVPGPDGLAALRLASALCPETPFICVTGSLGEETAVEVMRAGAADYIMKEMIKKLPMVVARAVAKAKVKKERKSAEEEQCRLALMLDAAPGAITIHDIEGRHFYANQRALDLYGYTRDEFLALNVRQLDVPESRQLFRPRVKELLARGELTFEAFHLKKDGTILPLEISAKLITWGDKKAVLSIGTDITCCKKAEEEQCRLALMLDAAPGAITIHDIEGRHFYANQRALDLHGYTRDEFLALNVRQLDVPESRQLFEHRVREFLDRGELTFEVSHLKKDGTILPLEISAKLVTWGDKKAVLSIGTDITCCKKAEEEQCRLALMLDAAPGAITIHDIEGRHFYANQRALDLHGYTRDEFLALNVRQLDVPESRQLFRQRVKELLARGELTFEVSHYKKDGTILPMELTAKPITWGNKKAVLSIGTDITGRRQAESKLREKEYMLSESQRLGHIGSWLYNMTGPISWSDELYRLYGVSPAAFTPTGESLLSLIHTDDRPAMRVWITDCAEGKKPGALEYRVILPDGTIRFLSGAGQLVTGNGNTYMAGTVHDITGRVKVTEALKKSNLELKSGKKLLEDKNTALREVLAEIEIEKNKLKDDITTNVNELILPIIKRIRLKGGASRYPALLEKSLKDLVSSFGRRLTEKDFRLTPKEIEICNMIKSGLSTKEIAHLLVSSRHTIDKHRNNIRKKLGLSKKGVNLTSLLQNL